ncbi:MAG: OB-fold nucleic acid binding domain-containing protein, partial [Pseudomonadales bacterium]
MSVLNISLLDLKGAGPKTLEKLARLGIVDLQSLLFHLPHRYEDRTRLTAIGSLRAGGSALFKGAVLAADISHGKRRSLVCRLHDGTGFITLRFFHFSASQKKQLQQGNELRCFGDLRFGPPGLECAHPEYRVLKPGEEVTLDKHLTAVYPTTEGLSQYSLRKLMAQALHRINDDAIENLLPRPLSSRGPEKEIVSLAMALHYLH